MNYTVNAELFILAYVLLFLVAFFGFVYLFDNKGGFLAKPVRLKKIKNCRRLGKPISDGYYNVAWRLKHQGHYYVYLKNLDENQADHIANLPREQFADNVDFKKIYYASRVEIKNQTLSDCSYYEGLLSSMPCS